MIMLEAWFKHQKWDEENGIKCIFNKTLEIEVDWKIFFFLRFNDLMWLKYQDVIW